MKEDNTSLYIDPEHVIEVEGIGIVEKQLYEMANEIVGQVGEPSNCYCSDTGEDFLEVVILFKTKSELLNKWKRWIKGYKAFAEYQFKGCVGWTLNPLKIYWNTKPEFLKHRKGIYARLLITNHPEIFK